VQTESRYSFAKCTLLIIDLHLAVLFRKILGRLHRFYREYVTTQDRRPHRHTGERGRDLFAWKIRRLRSTQIFCRFSIRGIAFSLFRYRSLGAVPDKSRALRIAVRSSGMPLRDLKLRQIATGKYRCARDRSARDRDR